MSKREGTKEKYIIEALKLFAERGFDAVKLSEIAERVGVVPSALYKHFPNKEQLYEAILEKSINGFEKMEKQLVVDLNMPSEATNAFLDNTVDALLKKTMALYQHTMRFEEVVAFRKLMMLEQFHMKELAEMYNERYIFSQYEYFEILFKELMRAGKMKQGDAYCLAIQYISPVIVMVELVDRQPEKAEWAWQTIENSVRQFCKDYIVA